MLNHKINVTIQELCKVANDQAISPLTKNLSIGDMVFDIEYKKYGIIINIYHIGFERVEYDITYMDMVTFFEISRKDLILVSKIQYRRYDIS
jgi:hypothetical protein